MSFGDIEHFGGLFVSNMPSNRRLDSWKEIADYLRREVRTAIRWEKEKGLPVHRIPGGSRQTVFAFSDEIDAWMSGQSPEAVVSVAPASRARESQPLRLAVLPFSNGAGEANEHLADGLTETLIHRLSQTSSLRVIARGTAFTYKGKGGSAAAAGRDLKASFVLTGCLTWRDPSWIINAEMVDSTDGAQIWGSRYTRTVAELLTVTEHIAEEVLRTLRVPINAADRERVAKLPTLSSEAYLLYLKGRSLVYGSRPQGLLESVRYFEQAIAKDPTYAQAHAALAIALFFIGIGYGDLPPRDVFARADAAARKAAELDDNLGEAHCALGWATPYHGFDMEFAGREFRRAIELNPSDVFARLGYAYYLSALKRHGEAIAEAEQALALDPCSATLLADCGFIYAVAGDPEMAMERAGAAIQISPNWAVGYYVRGWAYLWQDRPAEAIVELEHSVSLHLLHTVPLGLLGYAYGRARQEAGAKNVLERLRDLAQKRHVSGVTESLVWIGLGDLKKAIAALQTAYTHREPFLYMVHSWKWFDPLRSDPRFRELETSLGLLRS